MRREGLIQLKNPMTSGIESATFQLVVSKRNRLISFWLHYSGSIYRPGWGPADTVMNILGSFSMSVGGTPLFVMVS
jgi:hypothetical protein